MATETLALMFAAVAGVVAVLALLFAVIAECRLDRHAEMIRETAEFVARRHLSRGLAPTAPVIGSPDGDAEHAVDQLRSCRRCRRSRRSRSG